MMSRRITQSFGLRFRHLFHYYRTFLCGICLRGVEMEFGLRMEPCHRYNRSYCRNMALMSSRRPAHLCLHVYSRLLATVCCHQRCVRVVCSKFRKRGMDSLVSSVPDSYNRFHCHLFVKSHSRRCSRMAMARTVAHKLRGVPSGIGRKAQITRSHHRRLALTPLGSRSLLKRSLSAFAAASLLFF